MKIILFWLLPMLSMADTGEVLFQNICAQCHGAAGEGNPALKAPAIAGMAGWYVQAQLTSFREGHRGTAPTDAPGLLMAAISKSVPKEHFAVIAERVQKLKPVQIKASEWVKDANLSAGRELYEERCMECHRYNGTGEIVFGSPPLIHQADWYLLEQILKYKDGRRGATAGDPNGAKMVFASQSIADEKAAKNVVAYILSLNPGSRE